MRTRREVGPNHNAGRKALAESTRAVASGRFVKMSLEERAACIADQTIGAARGSLRRTRVYDKALRMLREVRGVDLGRDPLSGIVREIDNLYAAADDAGEHALRSVALKLKNDAGVARHLLGQSATVALADGLKHCAFAFPAKIMGGPNP